MLNKTVRYSLLLFVVWGFSFSVNAQRERSMARKGNRFYADSAFTKAEVAYMKALSENADFKEAQYNMANTSIRQQKFDEALEQLEALSADARESNEAAEIYHNMGNAYLGKYQISLQDQEKAKSAGEILDKGIEAYKQSLRYNAADDETRYNLAVAQKLKKEGPPPQDQQQKQDQKDQDKKDQDQKEQDQKQNDQQKEQQDKQDQQQQQQPDKISKEDAEKILNAMMQEEKELQEDQKEKQKAKARAVRVEKEW